MFTTKKTSTATTRRLALGLTLPLVGILALAGCSATDGDASTATGATTGANGSTSAGTNRAPDVDALTTAAKTALAAASGSELLSIEQEAGGSSWEILLAAANGAEQEIHTGQDGSSITAGPSAKTTDPEDLAENKTFLAESGVGYEKAAATMVDTVDGSVTELGLDDHLGTTVWEGDVIDASGAKHSIRIDAASGDVVTTTVESDD